MSTNIENKLDWKERFLRVVNILFILLLLMTWRSHLSICHVRPPRCTARSGSPCSAPHEGHNKAPGSLPTLLHDINLSQFSALKAYTFTEF